MDSQRYDELHGGKNWVGLLDPLDLDLRNLILSYGDLTSAAERSFNNDECSKYNGYCNYGKSSFFKAMLPRADSKYQVTSFIYATAKVNFVIPLLIPDVSREDSEFESNWIGYVAVSSDEYSKSIGRREICVVWRGTARAYEWIDDIAGAEPVSAEPLLSGTNSTDAPIEDTPQVMGGWLTIYTTSDPNSEFIPSSAQTQLQESIKEVLGKYTDEKISITCLGHSLGACLAVLSAFDLARNVVTPDINVSAFVFASPQVGNQSFKEKIEELPNLKIPRVRNEPDIVPLWPSKIVKWATDHVVLDIVPSELKEYVDVGVEILIDTRKSPYFTEIGKLETLFHLSVFHDLEGTLHTLSVWIGKNGDFNWDLVKRSYALVNMSNNILKKKYKIPTSWWVEKNKRMVLNDNGDWDLPQIDRPDHDLPAEI